MALCFRECYLSGTILLEQKELTNLIPSYKLFPLDKTLWQRITINGYSDYKGGVCVDEFVYFPERFESTGASAIKGTGDLVFALGGTVTFSPETTVNGVPISDYDAATNDVRITFETSELVWESRVSGSNVEITDPLLADDRFVFRFDRYANGEFVEFYATDSRVSDVSASAYETTSNWNGAASPTLVDASAEPGWNYYRVRLDEPVEKGGVLLNAYASPTRYVAVWVGNDEPTRTYYYRGGAKGSFIEPGDWTLTSDGLVPCVEKPTQAGATFYVGGSFEVVES